MEVLDAQVDGPSQTPQENHRIPIRNLWLLFLYASGLAEFKNSYSVQVEQSADLKSLIARLLCFATERRLRRNLSFGYRLRDDEIRRVRGRINILASVSHGLFKKGKIACRFTELTIDTPRNRLLRAAHSALSGLELDDELSHRCQTLSWVLARAGVSGLKPSRSEMASDQIGRHEAEDRLVVSLANAVFDLVLPTEEIGTRPLFEAQRDEEKLRKLFEKAVGNFYKLELAEGDGWRVSTGKKQKWPVVSRSSNIEKYLPIMKTDIVLENVWIGIRTIIDTKFTEVLRKSQHGNLRFKSSHIFQIYSYVRSQENLDDPMSLNADGLLIYPSVGVNIDEAAMIQSHRIRFVTIDLSRPSEEVIERLRTIPFKSTLPRPALLPGSGQG